MSSTFVGDAHEKEPLGRRRRAGTSALARLENSRNLGDRPIAATDVDECARDGSDHIVQEAISLNINPDPVGEAIDGEMGNGADAAGAVGPVGLETAKIMGADETGTASAIARVSSR